MIRWSWRQEAKPEPRQMINLKHLELETAKEILGEVFHARSGEVGSRIRVEDENMIHAKVMLSKKEADGYIIPLGKLNLVNVVTDMWAWWAAGLLMWPR